MLMVLGWAAPLQADVGTFLGKPVASVRLVIEGRDTTDPALTEVVETRIGQPLLMAQVRETITHLFSLGRFEDVRVDATLENGGVALRYDISPIHPVTRIRFLGADAPGIDRDALRRAIVDRYGVSPLVGRAADMSAAARRRAARARIPAPFDLNPPGDRTLTRTRHAGLHDSAGRPHTHRHQSP